MKTPQQLAYQRSYRQKNNNSCTHKYEKTPKGFLMRAYRNMQSRVSGVQLNKAHLYKGLSLLPREEFYRWALNNSEFWRLFKQWVVSDYSRKLTPSINRTNTYKGYEKGNIEWLTHSINSSLGGSSPKRAKSLITISLRGVYQHVNS